MNFKNLLLFLALYRIKAYSNGAIRQPIEKVCIIGSGVGGLGIASCLKRVENVGVKSITIFEARDKFLQPSLGGGVQISGGSAVLRNIGLLKELDAAAEPLKRLISRNSNGERLLQLDLELGAKINSPELIFNGKPMLYSIMRDKLLSLLYESLNLQTTEMPIRIQPNKKCAEIVEDVENGKVKVIFEDGTSESGFDLVIGADGAGSNVKKYINNESKVNLSNRTNYSGIRISFCITPTEFSRINKKALREDGRGEFHQWFGDNCYVLSASYGGLKGTGNPSVGIQHMLAVVYKDKGNAKFRENPEWKTDDIKNNILKKLKDGNLYRKEFIDIVKEASMGDGKLIDLGTSSSLLNLDRWVSRSGRVVLIGDSAHAMPPFLGQGANQALQDAYCLTESIKKYNNGNGMDPIKSVGETYEKKRKLHTSVVGAKSTVIGQMETLGGPIGCFVKESTFRALGKFGIAEKEFFQAAKPVF